MRTMKDKGNVKAKRGYILAAVIAAALFLSWNFLIHTQSGCYSKITAVGSSVCHQLPSHSFSIGSLQFPVCARCTGLYMGSFIGITYGFFSGKKRALPKKGFLILLVILFLLWGGDGLNSLVNEILNRQVIYQTTNFTRLVTGYGMGLVMSTALVTLFNNTIWKEGQDRPVLENIYQLIGYVLLCAISSTMLLGEQAAPFQIAAYFTIFTALTIITLLYTIFWVIIWKKENQYTNFQDLLIFLVLGFATAMGQITIFTNLRDSIL
jgi:uncharacterized membrane protein